MAKQVPLQQLNLAFTKIFALPITRSTFREIQNVVLLAFEGDQSGAQSFLQCLIRGELKESKEEKEFSARFGILTGVSKDVHDHGEFLNMITSDILTQQERVLFSNRIRRVDGTELFFLSDIEATLQIVRHYLVRMHEVVKLKKGKEHLNKYQAEINALVKLIQDLA